MPKVPGVCALFARPCGANVAVRLTSEAQLGSAKEQILNFDLELFLCETLKKLRTAVR